MKKSRLILVLCIVGAVAVVGLICAGVLPVFPSDPLFSYDGNAPMLHQAVQRSVPTVLDAAEDQIVILEQDPFGRVLYLFVGEAMTEPLYPNPDRKTVVLGIAQAYDAESVSYFMDKNVLVGSAADKEIPPVSGKQAAYAALADRLYGSAEIESFKAANFWQMPLDLSGCRTVTEKKTAVLPDAQANALFDKLADHHSEVLLDTDSAGNSIYALHDQDNGAVYLVFVSKAGEIPKRGVQKIEGKDGGLELLRRFRQENGWDVGQETAQNH